MPPIDVTDLSRFAMKEGSKWKACLTKNATEGYRGWKASFTSMTSVIKNGVKELRVARKWTQEQLAEAVGVSRQSINAIERNRYVPSLELALTFARVFSCPVEYIFRLESKL